MLSNFDANIAKNIMENIPQEQETKEIKNLQTTQKSYSNNS